MRASYFVVDHHYFGVCPDEAIDMPYRRPMPLSAHCALTPDKLLKDIRLPEARRKDGGFQLLSASV